MPHAALLSLVTQTDGPQQGQRYPHDWTMHFSHEHLYLCVAPVKPISMNLTRYLRFRHRFSSVPQGSSLLAPVQDPASGDRPAEVADWMLSVIGGKLAGEPCQCHSRLAR